MITLGAAMGLADLELDALGDGHAVLRDLRCAKGLLKDHVATLRAERHLRRQSAGQPVCQASSGARVVVLLVWDSSHLHSVGQFVDASKHERSRLVAEAHVLAAHVAHEARRGQRGMAAAC